MGVSSMTGFARIEREAAGISWAWELKSVNGRSLDLRLRLPPGYDGLEPALRGALAGRLRRGSINANLTVNRLTPPTIRINREMLGRVLTLIGELAAEVEAAPPRLDGLIGLRGVIETVDDEPEDVVEARRVALIGGWNTALGRLVASASSCAAAQPEALRARLEQSLAALGDLAPDTPKDRVAQELALLVSRGDVREELDRLRAHVAQAGELVAKGEGVGR